MLCGLTMSIPTKSIFLTDIDLMHGDVNYVDWVLRVDAKQ